MWAYIVYISACMSSSRVRTHAQSRALPRRRTPTGRPCGRAPRLRREAIANSPTNYVRLAEEARERTGECLDGGGDEQERERSGPEERHCCALFTEEAACVNVQISRSPDLSVALQLVRNLKKSHQKSPQSLKLPKIGDWYKDAKFESLKFCVLKVD